MADTSARYHHGSHQELLGSPVNPVPAGPEIDAIVVPTKRPPAYLSEVARLAQTLKHPLVTLHSGKWTTAQKAVNYLPAGLDMVAIDVARLDQLRLPPLRTSRLITGTIFERKSDLSTKRNLALVLGHMVGWSRILFLDDDITVFSPDDVRRASGLLDSYNAVGLAIGGFPDNSVVCHAYREAGGMQKSFVGGGALAVEVTRCISFFPDIYNDDWFYLLDDDYGLQPVAITGEVIQHPYDPFRNPDRARSEEFGDVLAEGVYWLLDRGGSIADANRGHWEEFLIGRETFIENVIGMVQDDDMESSHKARRIEVLRGSLGRLRRITPIFCESYVKAWMADRARWRQHLATLPVGLRLHQAVVALTEGYLPLTWHAGRPADGPQVP